MKIKNLLVLTVLMGGLGTYIYFDIQKPAEKKLAEGPGDRILRGDLQKIDYFLLELKSGKIELQKENDLWRLISPVKDLASDSKIKNLVSALEKFRKTKTIKEAATSVDQFGLKDPNVKLTYRSTSEKDPFSLLIGGQNPSYSGTYAQVVGSSDVILTTLDLDYLGTQRVDDFREMKLSTVAPENFHKVEIEQKGKSIVFQKVDKNWKMISPYQLPVDPEFVRSQIEKISLIRANSFLDKAPAGLKGNGIRAIVGFDEGFSDMRTSKNDPRPNGTEIQIFESSKPDTYYAKSDKTDWSTISKFHFESLSKNAEDYVKKTFDDFLIGDVEKLTIQRAASKSFEILRKSDSLFVANQGNQKEIVAQTEKVEDILRQLRNMRALKFLDQSTSVGTSKPSLSVGLGLKGEEIREYRFDLKKDIGELWVKAKDSQNKTIWLRYVTQPNPVKVETFDFVHVTKEEKKE